MSERCGLRFGLLGTPAVYDAEGEPRAVRSAKGRALLAALLLEPDRVVSLGILKDALWGEYPPASAHASLQNHVTRLRRLLDDPRRLNAVPPGYRLCVGEGELDVRVFDGLVAKARAAHAERDWARVVALATEALALWRGAPLSGLPDTLVDHPLVPRLEEARLLVLQWRYDAELGLGTGLAALAPGLAALVAQHPLREAFHRQLMLVLHRTGRQAEALAVHRALRGRLIEELGVEPGVAVREAHEEVLRAPVSGSGEGSDSDSDSDLGLGSGARPREVGRGEAHGAALSPDDTPAGDTHTGDAHTSGGDPLAPEGATGPAPTGHAVRADGDARTDDGTRTGDGTRTDHDAPSARTTTSGPPTLPTPASTTPTSASPGTSASPRAHTRPHPHPHTRPAQLPPAPAHFTGRADTARDLRLALGGGARVAVVSGMAGVGKSALALHVAHALAEEFPDGQLYFNLRGATPGMTPTAPAQALTSLLRDLGAEPRNTAGGDEDTDAASALLRSLLAPTRTLLVLDDAATAAQVRPLLPAGSGCAVIVTSRSPLTALDGAARFPLDPLSDGESAALLRAVSGRAGLDPGHPLVELAGRLPLALRIVAARLAARRALTPDALAELLTASGGRLHHLEYDDLSVRRSLAVALDALRTSDREADRDAARALAGIGALDLPAYGVPLLARLLGTDERRAEAALDRLVDVALLDETSFGRYAPHDLVRDFARETAAMRPPGPVTDPDRGGPDAHPVAGADPVADANPVAVAFRWYAESARRTLLAIMPESLERADRLSVVDPHLARPEQAQQAQQAQHAAPTAPVDAEPPLSVEAAFAWGDTELANILALTERHRDASELLPVLVCCLFPYLQRRGRLTELGTLGALALAAARRQGDRSAQAQALTDLAGTHFMSGRPAAALDLNDEALTHWRALGLISRMRRGLNNRGLLLDGLGRHAESAEALHQSLDLAKELADPLSEATTLSHLGNLYEHTDARAAITHHERSLAIGEAIGHVVVRQTAHCNIGYAHLTLGEPADARAHFEESLRLHGELEDWHGASQARLGLVRALRGLSRDADAARECAALLDRAEQRGDAHMTGLARHQHGLLLRASGDEEAAYEQWATALRALDGTDSKVTGELRTLLAERG